MRILHVEDSRLMRERVAEMIGAIKNVELVGQVETVAAAMESIQQQKPDVVVLDMRLPDGNGFKILDYAKALKPSPTVILLTAFGSPAYREKAKGLGADYFFDKSNEFDQVTKAIKQIRNKARVAPVRAQRRKASPPKRSPLRARKGKTR